MSPTLHQFAFFVFVVSSHALQDTVARDHKNIMRSVKGSNAEIVTVKAHGNRSVPKKTEKLKEMRGQPKAAANKEKSFARTERKVLKDNTAKRNVRPLHHAHARRISFAGEPSPLNQNGFSVTGQPMLERKDLPSTSPTAFVIQSSGDVDVSGTDGASSSHLVPLAIVQQAPTVAPGTITVAPGTVTIAPGTVTVAPGAVTGAPAAPAAPVPAPAPAAPAPAPATPAGGSGFFGTFVMLLLFAGLIVGAGALFVKLRKDAKNNSSRAGRLGALLQEDTGDSQFWKSAKSRQSSRRSVQGTPSETEEEAIVSSKSEETERKTPRSPSAYRERRSASQSSSKAKNEGEDSEADTSNSRYKKGRSQSRAQSEGPKVDSQDSGKSNEGQDFEKDQGKTSITERDPNAPTTYRGRRNQLTSSRSERTSRSQSQSENARQQKDEQGDNVTV